jgi:hypothetical protein
MTKALLRIGGLLFLGIFAYFVFLADKPVDIKFDKTAIFKGERAAKGVILGTGTGGGHNVNNVENEGLTDFVYFDIKSGDEAFGKIVIGLYGGIVPITGTAKI